MAKFAWKFTSCDYCVLLKLEELDWVISWDAGVVTAVPWGKYTLLITPFASLGGIVL